MSDAAGTPAAESSPNAASSPHRQQLDKSTQTTESFMQLLKQSPPSLAKPIPLRPHTPSSTAAGRSSGSDADPQLASSFERTIVQRAPTGRSGLTVMAVVGTQLSATTASLAELSVSSTTQTQSSSPQHHSKCHGDHISHLSWSLLLIRHMLPFVMQCERIRCRYPFARWRWAPDRCAAPSRASTRRSRSW